MTEIQIPDFDFSSFYYADILAALINHMRTNVPEITDENAYEPYIQLLRAFALVGHLNNVNLDMTAREALLPTARLRESVKSILKLIGYELSESIPATAEMVMSLTKTFASPFEVLPLLSAVATEHSETNPAIIFEALTALTIARTDEVTAALAEEASAFTDYTTEANTDLSYFTPWTTPAAGDKLYIGHSGIMWNQLTVDVNTGGIGLTGIWEYYDGDWNDANPTGVEIDGNHLKIDLTSLLGATDVSGLTIRVTLISTSAYEEVVSQWDGSKNYIETTGFLGQTVTISEDADDYIVGSLWHSLEATDGTYDATNKDLNKDGDVTFTLPQAITKRWALGDVEAITAYWMRYRIISVSTPTSPSIDRLKIDQGSQFIMHNFVQGLIVGPEVIGSSTGQANQSFQFTQGPLIGGSETVYVDSVAWIRVDNFLNSEASDDHYILSVDDDGIATVTFGNGISGRVPPAGANNIEAEYRVNAEDNGNVGTGTITVNKSGISYVTAIRNPRQAIGWTAREGSTPALLEQVKLEGPASIRALARGTTPPDVEDLSLVYTTSGGSRLVSRAKVIEEVYGVKTAQCVVVGLGGATLTGPQQTEMEEYFNGNLAIRKKGVLVLNQRVYIDNYVPRVIDVVTTVYGGTKSLIETALTQLLNPEAKTQDGLNWEWEFGELVPTSRIIAQIFTISGVRRVDLTTPAADVTLGSTELPKAGTLTITMVP